VCRDPLASPRNDHEKAGLTSLPKNINIPVLLLELSPIIYYDLKIVFEKKT
jgi:hypothetical protein